MRGAVGAVGALGTALLLAGCGSPIDGRPPVPTAVSAAPAPGPAREPAPAGGPAVPVVDADLAAATVAAEPIPVALEIPALGLAVPVDPVGVAADGQMEVPPLAERAGWYRFGSAPGEPSGTAVIAAHVDSVASAGLGPFARLGDLAAGDVVAVTLDDGAVRRFEVTTVTAVAKTQVSWPEVFDRDGHPRLVLITCGGSWLSDARSYSDNLIVTAEPTGA